MKRLARIISMVINPLILPPVLLGLAAAHAGAPAPEIRLVVLVALLLFFVLPVAYLVAMVRMGKSRTIEVREREQRQAPLLVSLALMVFAATAFFYTAPVSRNFVVALTCCLALNTFLIMKITERFKISLHVAGVAGFATMLAALGAFVSGMGIPLPASGLVAAYVAIPVVMWSRVASDAHTRPEVMWGALFGLVIPPIEVWLLGQLDIIGMGGV